MASDLSLLLGSLRGEWMADTLHRLTGTIKAKRYPIVTLARQCGAGGHTLTTALTGALNARDAQGPPWHAYDKELVEKIAQDHELSQPLIESLEDHHHGYLRDLADALASLPSELALFNRTAETIVALARSGRAVILGLGGVFLTRRYPGSVHVLLVAPLDYRAQAMAEQWGCPVPEAKARCQRVDENRIKFYKTHFPSQRFEPASFDLVINTQRVDLSQQVGMLLPLIPTAEVDAHQASPA